jgi:mono/diheme cytochrome c family protein
LPSQATVPFHPTRRYTALQRIGPALAFAADDPYAAALFQKNCATCHQAGGEAAARIPQLSVLKTRTPNSILRTLESGAMKQQAAVLSTNERQALMKTCR